MATQDIAEPSGMPRGLAGRLAALGPGVVFIIGAVGAPDLVSGSIAGSQNGYGLLWLLPVVLLARFVYLDASARYVMVTGETLMTGCGRSGRWLVWVMFLVILIKRHLGALTKFAILGVAAHSLLPLPTRHSTAVWSLASWALGFALMYWGRYRLVERLSKPFAVALGATLAAAAFLSKPDLVELAKGALIPSLPSADGAYTPVMILIAVIAATVGSIGNLRYSAFVHERGWRDLSFQRSQRFDLVLSLGGMLVMLALIQIAAAGALQGGGIEVKNLSDLVPIFSRVLGPFGGIVFAAGLWMAAFTSYVSGGTGEGLMMADMFHRYIRPSAVIAEQDRGAGGAYLPGYRWWLLYLFLSPLYVLFTDWTPVGLVLVQAAGTVVALPIIISVVLRLTADKKLMGPYANGWLTNLVLGLIVVMAIYLSYEGAVEFLEKL